MIDLHKGVESVTTIDHAEFEGQRSRTHRGDIRGGDAMRDWITDRKPMEGDADYGIPGYNGLVFATNSTGQVTICSCYGAAYHGFPWQPIMIPEPYVKPKRFKASFTTFEGHCVIDTHIKDFVAKCLPSREAAEEIAAIYERTIDRSVPQEEVAEMVYGKDNASLIAAAPEMLDALKCVKFVLENYKLSGYRTDEISEKYLEMVCHAIAKAEGAQA